MLSTSMDSYLSEFAVAISVLLRNAYRLETRPWSGIQVEPSHQCQPKAEAHVFTKPLYVVSSPSVVE